MATGTAKADTKESHTRGGHHIIEPVELLIIRVRVIL